MSSANGSPAQSTLRQSDAKFSEWNAFWKKNVEPLMQPENVDMDVLKTVKNNMEDIYQEVSRSRQKIGTIYDRMMQNGARGTDSFSPEMSIISDTDVSIHLCAASDSEERAEEPDDLSRSFRFEERRGTLLPVTDNEGGPPPTSRPINKKAALKNYFRSSSLSTAASTASKSPIANSSKSSPVPLAVKNEDTESIRTSDPRHARPASAVSNSRNEHRRNSPAPSLSNISIGTASIAGSVMQNNYFESVQNFEDLNLKPEIIRGLEFYGSKKPTLIQKRAIVPLLEGRSVIIEAPDRSGKCAVCTTAVLQRLDTENMECQIVICTADKASTERFRSLIKAVGQYMKPRMHVCDSASILQDIKRLKSDRQIVIATPETLEKLCAKRVLYLKDVKMFVIDNAACMKTSQNIIRDVFIRLPDDVQTVVFAPDIPPPMYAILKRIMRDPVCIVVDQKEWARSTSHEFWHGYYNVRNPDWKLETLKALFKSKVLPYVNGKSLVVCHNQTHSTFVAAELKKTGFPAYNMDSKKPLSEEFLTKSVGILIMTYGTLKIFTEKIGRLRLVVNYDLPQDVSDYIYTLQHLDYPQGEYRGHVVSFVTPTEMLSLQAIHDYLSITIEQIDSSALSELKRHHPPTAK